MRRPRIERLRTFALLFTFSLATVAACGDSLTGPSVADVAGTYTGPLTIELTAGGVGTVTATGSMRMVAQQDGDRVTLSGSMTLFGETESLGAISGTIDEAGVWTEPGSETGTIGIPDDECGYAGETRVRFSGSSLRIEISASRLTPTIDCPNISMSADLTRN